MSDDIFKKLADDIADGKDINWDEYENLTDEEKQWLEQLNSLENISKVFENNNLSKYESNGDKEEASINESMLFSWGHLEVVSEIGEGSFGKVYKAYDPILDREVALKLFKQGDFLSLQSRHLIEEAKRLAKVRNEHVLAIHGANIYDDRAGMWSDLIKGENLSHEKFQSQLSQKNLFDIMLSLAIALKAVHDANIVHGDIKPSNVMLQNDGKYMLMDFGAGIDKGNKGHEKDAVSGTPMFLAPEIILNNSTLSSATDIYAFGVLLFKLATMIYPIKANNVADVYFAHENKKYQLISGLRPDMSVSLKTLIQKMISIDPNDRPTAAAIQEKLMWIKEAPKRRNKKLIVTAIISTLLIGILISSIGLFKANESRKEAVVEKENAQHINEFLQDMLGSAANISQGREVKITDMLEIAANDLDNRFKGQPRIKAATLESIGLSYQHLLLPEESLELLNQSIKVKSQWLKPDDPDILNLKIRIALNYERLTKFDMSIETINHVLKLASKKPKHNQSIIEMANVRLASCYGNTGELLKAEKLYKSVINTMGKTDVSTQNIAYLAHQGLANNYFLQSKYKLALESAEKAQIEHEKWPNSSITNLMVVKDIQSKALVKLGQYELAEATSLEALKINEKHFGKDNTAYLNTLSNYSAILQEQGKLEKSLPLQLQALELSNQIFGPDNINSIKININLANVKVSLGLLEEGESIMRNTLQLARDKVGNSHMDTLILEYNLAELLNRNLKFNDALELATINFNKMSNSLGAKHLYTLLAQDNIALSYMGLEQFDKAEPLLKDSIQNIEITMGSKNPYIIMVQKHYIDLLMQSNKIQFAKEQVKYLIRLQTELFGPDHPDTIETLKTLNQLDD